MQKARPSHRTFAGPIRDVRQYLAARRSLIGILIAAYYILSPGLYLVRVLIGDFGAASVALRILPVLLMLALIAHIATRRTRIDSFSVYLMGIYLYGMTMGLLNGHGLINVVSSAMHYVLGLLIYIWAMNTPVFSRRTVACPPWCIAKSPSASMVVLALPIA